MIIKTNQQQTQKIILQLYAKKLKLRFFYNLKNRPNVFQSKVSKENNETLLSCKVFQKQLMIGLFLTKSLFYQIVQF